MQKYNFKIAFILFYFLAFQNLTASTLSEKPRYHLLLCVNTSISTIDTVRPDSYVEKVFQNKLDNKTTDNKLDNKTTDNKLDKKTITDSLGEKTSTDSLRDNITPFLKRHTFYQSQLQVLTANAYLGRSDTNHNLTYLPSFTYNNKSGFFITSSLYYTPAKPEKVDGLIFETGYNLSFTPDLTGSISLEKTFFAENSTAVKSVISSSISGSIDYDCMGIITPSLGVEYNINRKGIYNDLILETGISHDFDFSSLFTGNGVFLISPSISMNTGTQNFNDANFEKTQNLRKGKKKTIIPLTAKQIAYNNAIDKIIIQGQKIQLLDVEFSLPLLYTIGKLAVNFIPTFSIPSHMLPQKMQQAIDEKANCFFAQVGFSYRF